ncbi:MAG: hypothetical protein R3D52_01315 [Xanthobacteraceae bacterium]
MVDSIVFLWLAFGSLDFLAGQVVGKAWMVLLSILWSPGCVGATPRSVSPPPGGDNDAISTPDVLNRRRSCGDAIQTSS